MVSNQVQFRVYKRDNTFAKTGKEWALSVNFVDSAPWVIKTWEKQPAQSTIVDIIDVIMKSFEIYHKHLSIPPFTLSIVE